MHQEIKNTRTYLYGHTSPESAYVVEDYPWGFRLRTTIRYWVESKNSSNGGQRFVSQTINPKTGVWCSPKRSTYSPIIIMFLNENEHVKCCSLSSYDNEEALNEFKNIHLEHLSEFQKQQLKELIGINQVMKHVKFEVRPSSYGPVSLLSNDPEEIAKREKIREEQEQNRAEQKIVKNNIARAINYEISRVVL